MTQITDTVRLERRGDVGDGVGLDEVARTIRHYAETVGGAHWQPSPLLEKLAADGARLSGYGN